LNFQQLKAICEVVDREFNISEAARALCISQPAISKQIRAFEIEMQTAIFIRSKGRLAALTPTGRRVLFAAKNALGTVAEIRSICGSEEDGVPTKFLIAASRSMARDLLPDIIGKFMERYPDVEISIIHGSLSQMTSLIINGEVSLAITIENGTENDKIIALPFDEIPRIVVVPQRHPLLRLRKLSLEAMSSFPLVLYDDSYSIRREVLQAFKNSHLEPRIVVNASGAEVIKAYVSRGLGIAVLAKPAYNPVNDTNLRAIPAGHLFPHATTRILLGQHHFLRAFEYDFIQLCAPAWTKKRITRLLDEKAPLSTLEGV